MAAGLSSTSEEGAGVYVQPQQLAKGNSFLEIKEKKRNQRLLLLFYFEKDCWLLGCTYSELVHEQLSKGNSFLNLKLENKKEIEIISYPVLLEATDAHALSLAGSGVTDRFVEIIEFFPFLIQSLE